MRMDYSCSIFYDSYYDLKQLCLAYFLNINNSKQYIFKCKTLMKISTLKKWRLFTVYVVELHFVPV